MQKSRYVRALVFGFGALSFATTWVEAQTTTRVSVNSSGVQANGASRQPRLSADGRFVVFTSSASNLSALPSSSVVSVYVHDRWTGATLRYGDGPSGSGHDGTFVDGLQISGDGTTLAWVSDATNLAPGDTNGADDVFVCIRSTGVVERVSVASGGGQANAGSSGAALTSDGRFVAFASDANNLTPGDSNGATDVFVRDRVLGTTVLVSAGAGGAQGDDASYAPAISADGRWLAFTSLASNFAVNDANQASDVFLLDLQAGSSSCVSRTSGGATGNGFSYGAALSGDGRFVGFSSEAGDLAAGDSNGSADVFVVDRVTQTIELISVNTLGVAANDPSEDLALSFDGRFVAFFSYARDLDVGDVLFHEDAFVRDRVLGVTQRANLTASGAFADFAVRGEPAISADGRVVAFASRATNLVANDANGTEDVYVRDLGSSGASVTVYCTAKVNSAGCTPLVSSAGEPRASGPDAFFATGVHVLNNKLGLVFWSLNPSATPFGGGTICAQPPLIRTPVQNSGGSPAGADCTGAYSFHFSQAYLASFGLIGGSIVHSQFWSRDPGFAPPNSIGLSDAIRFVVAP